MPPLPKAPAEILASLNLHNTYVDILWGNTFGYGSIDIKRPSAGAAMLQALHEGSAGASRRPF